MPLPLPSLDRRTFAELSTEGRALIPRLSPQWTDHNAHDPGITLLELFAWLVEMDIYRLDQTPEASQRAFLRLIGIELRPAQVAETVVVFTSRTPVNLVAGSQVKDPTGAVVFQTARSLNISPAILAAVFTGKGTRDTNVTALNAPDEKLYFPFGESAEIGNAIYIAFDQPLAGTAEEISLYVWTGTPVADRETREKLVFEYESIKAQLSEECAIPWWQHYSAQSVWEYRVPGGTWAPLKAVTDETRALTLSGPVRFAAPVDHEPDSGRYWVRCRLVVGHFECPPEIDAIALNAVCVRHEADVPEQLLGRSSGRAGQTFPLIAQPVTPGKPNLRKPVVPGSTKLRVVLNGVDDEPWKEVSVWDSAGPHQRVYLASPERGGQETNTDSRWEIAFGDGRLARVPRAGSEIRCSYRNGGGSTGNIGPRILSVAAQPGVAVTQPFSAVGGAPAETLAEAQARALASLAKPYRAVTLGDFEKLALQTPGVPIARARALAEHHPDMPCFGAPGNVTVVVVPSCLDAQPQPGPDFLRAVTHYLEPRRTLATEMHVIGPSYTSVTVYARLHVSSDADANAVQKQAVDALNKFFNPLRGGPDRDGWPIGRDVYRSEVLALLAGITGVEFVDQLGLQTDDDREPRCGNLRICPDHLIAAGSHHLDILENKLYHERTTH